MAFLRKKYRWLFLIIPVAFLILNAFRIHTFSDTYFETHSDVAIVLGAGTHDGKLSPIFRERINHGIMLLKTGKVKVIIFTGGVGDGEEISDSQVAKNYAIKNGIMASHIFIESTSTLTFTNLKYANQLMKKNEFTSALIVSDPYHMKRSMAMCEALQIRGLPSPTPTSMYRSWDTKLESLVYEAFYYSAGWVTGRYRKR